MNPIQKQEPAPTPEDVERMWLISELGYAHKIILHAIKIMTTEQKVAWVNANRLAGIESEGTTRHAERAAVLAAVGMDVRRPK